MREREVAMLTKELPVALTCTKNDTHAVQADRLGL